jgi:hypothetical protein
MSKRLTVVVLLALAATGACRQPAPAASQTSQPAPAATAGAPDSQSALAAFVPPNGTPAGWTRTKPLQAYSQDNLWEFIDGAAETYVGYGFQEALSTTFSQQGADVTVEIYQMSDPLHAFGIYAQERSPAVQSAAVGDNAHASSNVLNFRRGACYVKLTASRPDRPGMAAITALAKAVAERMPAGAALPRELTAFPTGNLVPYSTKFIPRDVLGQRDLVDGFEASYTDGPTTSRLVVVPCPSAQDAAAAFARYRAFVVSGGKPRIVARGTADEAFAGDDRFNGRVVGVRTGAVMVFSLGAATDGAGLSLAGEYLRTLAGR